MPESAIMEMNNVNFQNHHPVNNDKKEILEGLLRPQKMLNPKFFYDHHGSVLFEKITQQPEYYPTRTERKLLKKNAGSIADCCGTESIMLEPGSGSSEKVRILLDSLRPKAYIPMDIAGDFLLESAIKLGEQFPWLDIHAVCADFSQPGWIPESIPEGKRLVFYPGSTFGNLQPEKALDFLENLKMFLNGSGGVLIGIDLHKPESLLNAAYNDRKGITAQFNLNVLNNINQLAEGDFDPANFEHYAFYNTSQQRIEMHLVSQCDQRVTIDGETIAFNKYETIHTESSYKYTLDGFATLVANVGFQVVNSWVDEESLFSVNYLEL
ncbi:L-histidine N(alpha)-methyltransferase [Endozoicomonas atrinae]|uniref:L-histidine N(alpha)-methyltransferase n=1 Tax=Endozoicomonas atrinae TaxID=1333660 RepID=UPI0008257827|nr:L-histidine N(alpha)-methyltransferase [Endozoicomonas atrinae]